MKTAKILKALMLSLVLISFVACDDNESEKMNAGDPTISVKLVDAPGDYKAVNVEVVDVMIKMDDQSDDEAGWISLEAESGTVNLLDFTGGVSKVLVDRFPIPAGTLTQMRLVLGDGNMITIENESGEDVDHELKTPSAQQSGLKLKLNAEIEEGYTYDFVLDFDVDKSIVMAGASDNIILKPVLYVSTEVSSGIIEGSITPMDEPAMASVLVDDMGTEDPTDDFVISAMVDAETGAFSLWGVPAGTYDVIITPTNEDSEYGEAMASGVVVVNGEVTTISDPIELIMLPGSITGTVLGLTEGVTATASIMVGDDTVSDDTNESGVFLIEEVPAGTYTITISATGFVSQDVEVTVEPNTESQIADVTLVAE